MAALEADQKKVLHVLAYLMLRMGQEERAGRIYAALVALAPQEKPDRLAHTGLAAVAISQGQGAEALENLRIATEGAAMSSRKAALLLMKAQALWLEGRETEARTACDEYMFLAGKRNDS